MNRSIFIVIVDFLLLSLIAFARFDEVNPGGKKAAATPPAPNPAATAAREQDMVDILKVSLEQERQTREQLNARLTQTEAELRARAQLLADREQRIQEAQTSLELKSQEAQRLARERAALESQFTATRSNLASIQTQFAASSNEARLSKQRLAAMEADLRRRQEELTAASTEAQISRERLAAMEAELKQREEAFTAANSEARISKGVLAALESDLRRQQEELARMQASMSAVDRQRQAAELEKQKIAGQLQVAETEKRLTREQLETMRGEVQVARAEKAQLIEKTSKLTDEVSTLAEKSEELKTELQQNRPLAANTLFNEFLTNRIECAINASRRGLLGQHVERDKRSSTVLLTDGTNTFALLHVDDTPLSLGMPGTDWDRIMGSLWRGMAIASIGRISFWATDPRVLLLPVEAPKAKALGVKIYSIAPDPYKFQEAVLIGGKESYYGECRFELDAENPRYVRMDRNVFKRLVGNFSPSGGDLVFTKTGQVIGVMVNKEYCAVVNHFNTSHSFHAGVTMAEQKTGEVLSAMWQHVNGLPLKLQ